LPKRFPSASIRSTQFLKPEFRREVDEADCMPIGFVVQRFWNQARQLPQPVRASRMRSERVRGGKPLKLSLQRGTVSVTGTQQRSRVGGSARRQTTVALPAHRAVNELRGLARPRIPAARQPHRIDCCAQAQVARSVNAHRDLLCHDRRLRSTTQRDYLDIGLGGVAT